MLGGGLPLCYVIIRFGIHQTTTNQLAIMFTTALTEKNNKNPIGHELRHKCLITTLDYVIYALALQMLYRFLQIVPVVVGLVRETFYIDLQQLAYVHVRHIVLLLCHNVTYVNAYNTDFLRRDSINVTSGVTIAIPVAKSSQMELLWDLWL